MEFFRKLLQKKQKKSKNWIQTYTKQRFDLKYLDNNVIKIRDIVEGLTKQCRYYGQTSKHYSTAQHSVILSYLVPKELAFEALMHDGHEFVIGDVSSMVKPLIPDYKKLEKKISKFFRKSFALPKKEHKIIKIQDARICLNEAEFFLGGGFVDEVPSHKYEPIQNLVIHAWTENEARERFYNRFIELYKGYLNKKNINWFPNVHREIY